MEIKRITKNDPEFPSKLMSNNLGYKAGILGN